MPLRMALLAAACTLPTVLGEELDGPLEISGVYPHLAVYNSSKECGIGAVVPWAERLWVITYAPHRPRGSDDQLYEIDEALRITARAESVGGTPANRMIHAESGQLNIGPYFIDEKRNVRVIPPEAMPGRLTGTARHLFEPEQKLYLATMEEGLYEVDVETLEVTTLFPDANGSADSGGTLLPGYHGKGLYSAQGQLVYSNNGEHGSWGAGFTPHEASGCLAAWNGQDWAVLRRNQFTEVTGPGGIHGNRRESDPLWAVGWDRRSVILELFDGGEWSTFRLPKASHTYDGNHGWYTEWPRIREVGDAGLLMTMHGMMWSFPPGFRNGRTTGIRPLSSYLRIVGDFCAWQGRVVFGCDDSDLFHRTVNGQSHSNLWFVEPEALPGFGPTGCRGGVWVDDRVAAGELSDPYLLAGFTRRGVHLAHQEGREVRFTLLVGGGTGQWRELATLGVPAAGYRFESLPPELPGEWIRVRAEDAVERATVLFDHGETRTRDFRPAIDFIKLAGLENRPTSPMSLGLIRARGGDLGTLHFAASTLQPDGTIEETGYYELGPELKLEAKDDEEAHAWLKENAAISSDDFEVDAASVIVRGVDGVRYRLPRGPESYDELPESLAIRAIRDVVTERSLLQARGTFYELPRSNAGGVAKIRPIATQHSFLISDFCTWRGLLAIAGTSLAPFEGTSHFVLSEDGQAGLWLGVVDDLWSLGKPRGVGGPWLDTPVAAHEHSDPYLLRGYDLRTLELSHDADAPIPFQLEIDITGEGHWVGLARRVVPPGEIDSYEFDPALGAYWARLIPDRECRATARFVYR